VQEPLCIGKRPSRLELGSLLFPLIKLEKHATKKNFPKPCVWGMEIFPPGIFMRLGHIRQENAWKILFFILRFLSDLLPCCHLGTLASHV